MQWFNSGRHFKEFSQLVSDDATFGTLNVALHKLLDNCCFFNTCYTCSGHAILSFTEVCSAVDLIQNDQECNSVIIQAALTHVSSN